MDPSAGFCSRFAGSAGVIPSTPGGSTPSRPVQGGSESSGERLAEAHGGGLWAHLPADRRVHDLVRAEHAAAHGVRRCRCGDRRPDCRPGPPAPRPPAARAPPAGPAVRTIEVDRKLVHYVFSTEGAGLASAKLKGEKTRDQRTLTIAEGWAQLFGKDVPKGSEMDLAQP